MGPHKTLLFLLPGFLLAAAAFAEPVAMVTDISPGVSIMTGGKSGKLTLLDYLEPGMALRIDPGAHLSVTFFAKAVEYRFAGPASLTVQQDQIQVNDGKSQAHAVSLTKIAAAKKFTAAQRESVAQAAYEMRAGRPGLRLDDPVDTRLTGDGIVFSWDGPQPVGGYRLSLYDSNKWLVHEETVTANSWAPATGLLKAGSAYEWEILATLANGEVLTARGSFTVADSATAEVVRGQKPQAGASFSERVLYAVFLEEKGFRYDARRIWKELAKERPDDAVAKEHSMR